MVVYRTVGVVFLAVTLAACAPPQSVETAANSEQTATQKKDGMVLLQSQDAPGLVGKWNGEYVGQNNFRGDTILTLTAASADRVNGVFEYRWGSGNYDRYPDNGTITGEIRDGVLNFGSWALRLERDGEKLIFKTEQKIGGFPSSLRWRKTTPPLPSEQPEKIGTSTQAQLVAAMNGAFRCDYEGSRSGFTMTLGATGENRGFLRANVGRGEWSVATKSDGSLSWSRRINQSYETQPISLADDGAILIETGRAEDGILRCVKGSS